jgi:HEAT repeat protein
VRTKEKIVALLQAGDFDGLEAEARADARVLNGLIQALFLRDEEVAWRAAEGFGRAAAIIAETDRELCFDRIARLVGTLTDEEGGVCARLAAPAMGEAIARATKTFVNQAPMILFALTQPPLQAGAAWAIGRIGSVQPDLVCTAAPRVLPLLRSADPAVRGNAAWALGEILAVEALPELEALSNDAAALKRYRDALLHDTTVGELASAAYEKIRKSQGGK